MLEVVFGWLACAVVSFFLLCDHIGWKRDAILIPGALFAICFAPLTLLVWGTCWLEDE